MKRVNIGCGGSPTCGWYNYDNSPAVRLAKHPLLTWALDRLRLLNKIQKQSIICIRKDTSSNIMWADATKGIPLPDNSVEVLYTSHMVEHLDRDEIRTFLKEAIRVLIPLGIIRIVVPDLEIFARQYIADGDADIFMRKTHLGRQKPKTFRDKVQYVLVGDRHHQWMFDGRSMILLLSSMGFKNPQVLPPGSTTIPNPGELDLCERKEDSVYVEAYAPDPVRDAVP